jgi:hypothetical protein
MTTLIETLKNAQQVEMENGFQNGNLWNDLEDLINKIEKEEKEKKIDSLDGSQILSISLGL